MEWQPVSKSRNVVIGQALPAQFHANAKSIKRSRLIQNLFIHRRQYFRGMRI